MLTPLQNIPTSTGVAVLGVSSEERYHGRLREIFSHSNWEIAEARGCGEAEEILRATRVGVVLCDPQMPDGTWRDLLGYLAGLPWSPVLIVAGEPADDELWADVLNEGGYDVLAKPFDQVEVVRIVSLAWLSWKGQLAAQRNSFRARS